jgi:hypothetical protein
MGRLRLLGLFALGTMVAAAQPTFTRDIAKIFQAKCQQCHREGDIAPFPLDSYEAAKDWAEDIKRVVNAGLMPPWKPVAGHGRFRGDFSLTVDEKIQLNLWLDGGLERGEESDLPAPLEGKGEWVHGEPDFIAQMPEAYTPPRGKDMYRCFVLPTGFDETRWVNATDVLPGDRRAVHHVILYLDTTGEAEKLDAKEEGPGYTCYGGPGTPLNFTDLLTSSITLGGWAPGTRPAPLPEGIAMELPPKARLVMQVHYYTRSGATADQTRVGLYFSKEKVRQRLRFIPVVPLDARQRVNMEIPAGAAEHSIKSSYIIPPFFDAHIVNVFPHMHLLGTQIKLEVLPPAGEAKPLIFIDKWDFNWQGPYTYMEPVGVAAFNRIQLTCTYNNSESNPRNPNNPLKLVTWGEGTEDEMCLGFVGLTFDRERLQ